MTYKFIETKDGIFFVYDKEKAYLYKTTNGVNWAPLGRLNDPMGDEIEKKIKENEGIRKTKDWVLIEREKFVELLNKYHPLMIKELKEEFDIK